MIINNKHIAIFVSIVLLFIHCSREPAEYEIPVSTIIFTPLIIDSPVAEDFLFERPATIQLDSNGNIYVLDFVAQHILKFTPDGDLIQTIGRKGEGPGELKQTIMFTIDHNNNIYTLDMDLRRVSVFNSDGEFQSSFVLERGGMTTSIAINSLGEIAMLQPAMDEPLVNVYTTAGEYIRSIGKTRPRGTQWDPTPTPMATMNMNQGGILFNAVDDLLVLYTAAADFQIYSAGGNLMAEEKPDGPEIDSLRIQEHNIIERIRRERGLSSQMVIATSFFSGANFVDDDRILVGIRNQRTMYEYSTAGELLRIHKLKPDPESGIEELAVGNFVVTDDGKIFGVDADNLAVMKGRLNVEH